MPRISKTAWAVMIVVRDQAPRSASRIMEAPNRRDEAGPDLPFIPVILPNPN